MPFKYIKTRHSITKHYLLVDSKCSWAGNICAYKLQDDSQWTAGICKEAKYGEMS